jgi:aspartate-semialdehyde dehydrogenase
MANKIPVGVLGATGIENAERPLVSADCNRVPVIDGHTACVSLEFDLPDDKKPSLETIEKVWAEFSSVPQELKLPSAPEHPIVTRHENNRPQPVRDRNTKRGAALGGILNAELLKAQGFLG